MSTDLAEVKLDALRSINTLTRLVADIDRFTVSRDSKNIVKAMASVDQKIADLIGGYNEPDTSQS